MNIITLFMVMYVILLCTLEPTEHYSLFYYFRFTVLFCCLFFIFLWSVPWPVSSKPNNWMCVVLSNTACTKSLPWLHILLTWIQVTNVNMPLRSSYLNCYTTLIDGKIIYE